MERLIWDVYISGLWLGSSVEHFGSPQAFVAGPNFEGTPRPIHFDVELLANPTRASCVCFRFGFQRRTPKQYGRCPAHPCAPFLASWRSQVHRRNQALHRWLISGYPKQIQHNKNEYEKYVNISPPHHHAVFKKQKIGVAVTKKTSPGTTFIDTAPQNVDPPPKPQISQNPKTNTKSWPQIQKYHPIPQNKPN